MKITNIKHILASVMLTLSFAVFAEDNVDIIVTNDGESLKVYNLDYSPTDYCYYTNEPNSDDLKRIKKSDVLIIKLADGTKFDPNMAVSQLSANNSSAVQIPEEREPVTFTASRPDFISIEKKGKKGVPATFEKHIIANDGLHPSINFRVISAEARTLSVTKFKKGSEEEKYASKNEVECIIPEYVKVGSELYSVTEIDDQALSGYKFTDIQLPNTLKKIGKESFYGCSKLKRIIIPEGVVSIGKAAFGICGAKDFTELYISKSVKEIGDKAFYWLGNDVSYNKHYQGYLSCIPDWVTTGNCTRFNIDEEAVEAYMNRNK